MLLTKTLEKAKTGDMKAIGILYDASYERVYRYIFHRTLDTIHSEDIISEVYAKVIKGITKFRGNSEGEYYSWVFHICYTTIIDHSRQDIGIDSLEEIVFEPSYEEAHHIDARTKISEIVEFMKTFSEKERSIITMRIWDDLSYEEISSITGESLPVIRKILSRGLMKITANVTALSFLIFLLSHVW